MHLRPPRWAFLLLLFTAGCAAKPADPGLPPVLRWGADSSGGEPYLIVKKGEEPAGFEGDLAKYLADRLGVPSEFKDNDWNSLPNDLKRGDIDVILNGYEWTPDRARVLTSTVPYYRYRLALIVKKGGPIQSWDDLRKGRPRVGTLQGSAAERYVEQAFPNARLEASETEGVTGYMKFVEQGQMAATVQDLPAALWYLRHRKEFPDLTMVGDPVAPTDTNFYVLYLAPGAETLQKKIDEALVAGLKDGSLKALYEKYGLWNEDQESLVEVADAWPPEAERGRKTFQGRFLELLAAAGTTVLLSVLAMPLAVAIGLTVAVGRLYGPRWLSIPLGVYVEVTRGTPVLLQLLVLYYYLPGAVGYYFPGAEVALPAFWTGVLGLALNYGAYEAENYRAGLLAIPRGQMEAALSLGMSRWTALRRIVVPQAVRLVIPPVTNDFISLFKDSSICSVISVKELSARSRVLSSADPGAAIELAVVTAVLYLLMSYPLSLLARRLEQRQHPEGQAE